MVKYNNTPIIESLCEIKFSEDTKWDPTVPGLVFEGVKEIYPQKEQRIIQEININTPMNSPGSTSHTANHQIRKNDLAVFLTNDKKSVLQVGPRILSISRLKPYGTWTDFKSQIEYAFQKISERVELNGIQRIGLRYINKIEIQMDNHSVNLDKYFNFRLHCGEGLPQLHGGFIVGCIFPFSVSVGKQALCKVELKDAAPEKEDSMAFLLDIDYFLAKPRSFPVSQTLEWIEEAHGNVEGLFEGCILPPLREILGKVNE